MLEKSPSSVAILKLTQNAAGTYLVGVLAVDGRRPQRFRGQ